MNVNIYIEGQRLDLFSDETIEIKSSVQDVRDISKIFTDFSKGFTVPASKRNNNIFKRYYNADVVNGFDARIRKTATIDVDTLDFKRGKISLLEVSIKENEPEYYRIVFYGDTIKIKDVLADDKLNSLTWLNNFEHAYTSDNVKTGLTLGLDFNVDGTLYEKAVSYPLISYKRQFYYNSDNSDDTGTETLVNIAYASGKSNGIEWNELRPAIKLDLIIKAIQEKYGQYGLKFTQNFFERDLWKEIYINIYNDKSDDLLTGINVHEELSGSYSPADDIRWYYYGTKITPKAGYENIPYKIRLSVNDEVLYESTNNFFGERIKITSKKTIKDRKSVFNYNVKAEVFTELDFEYDANTTLYLDGGDFFNGFFTVEVFNNTYTDQVISLTSSISRQIKDIKVYDLLVGLIKTFNWVVEPVGDELYINDLPTWYSEGQIYDVTPYVSTESEKVKKSDIYNILNFKFKESKSILANEFKQSNGITYGNLEQRLLGDDGELIDGETLDIESVFENPIFERLIDINDNSELDLQYGLMADENFNTQVGEPFMFYLPRVLPPSLGFVDSLGNYEEISTRVMMPSHSRQIDFQSFNLNFNAEINEFTGQVFEDTIYQRFFSDYIGDIFSSRRRMYDYNAEFPNHFRSKLKLNDRLIIKDRRYIINSITTNLTEGTDKLELINDIYDAPIASDILNNSTITPEFEIYSFLEQSDDFRYVGIANSTIEVIDLGFGTSWVTINTGEINATVNDISFSIDENNTGAQRRLQIKVNDGVNNPTYTIIQETGSVTVDNTIITVDNTNITVDRNG